MIGRQDQHNIIGTSLLLCQQCRQCQRRRRVATGRFQQQAGLRRTGNLMFSQLSELFSNQETVLLVADDYRRSQVRKALQSRQCRLKQGQIAFVGGNINELLGVELPGKRPKSRSGATGQYDGDNHVKSFSKPGPQVYPKSP